ncbi:MAG: V-type ATPase 116kDa subunit family protein, partial [Angelakisella sp.]
KDSLLPWSDYKVPLGETETKTCYIRLMTFPVATDIEATEKELAENATAILYKVGSDKDQHFAVLITYKSDLSAAEDLLRQRGASRVNFAELSSTPSEEIAACTKQIEHTETEISEAEQALKMLAKSGDILKLVFDSVQTEIECKRAEQKLLHTQETCLMGAWIPVRKKEKVEKLLEQYTCFYHYEKPQNEEETPILLKNNKWIAPFESVTEMYSLPSSNSIDPNPFMAPFFFLFFGMMLSDAGYGLILLIGGLIGSKLMNDSKLMKMLGYCGLSTIFWGILYGSYFGDAIPQIARTFFNVEIAIPTLIDPLKDPITILILSFAFGIMHVFVGMGLKAYLMVKRGHPWAAFFDVGMWYFVIIGLLLLLAGGILGTIGQFMAIGGAVGLVLTQGRDKKNIFMKAASGVLSLYDITGYFSDVLSYSRIMALGLATGVIASVVNTMGTMPGKSFIGVIAFILVFVFGHLLNFAINALGSYVHTSRLQYVEFFGKFFEGGGGVFMPLRANTKYVNINKQEDN